MRITLKGRKLRRGENETKGGEGMGLRMKPLIGKSGEAGRGGRGNTEGERGRGNGDESGEN